MGLPSNSKPKVVEVAAGLLFRDGKLLITQRRPQDHLGGLWEFPGGKRECDESYETCLVRELREELGIEVEPLDLLETIEHAYPEKTVLLKFYRCRLLEAEPAPLACHAIAWVKRDELDTYQFPAADEKLLERLKQSPRLWV